jgi:hypothetical protein
MPVSVEREMRNLNGEVVGKTLIQSSVLTAVTEPPPESPTESPSAEHLPAKPEEGGLPCTPIAGGLVLAPMVVIGRRGHRRRSLDK